MPLNETDIISAKLNDIRLRQANAAADKVVTGVTTNGSSEPIKTQPTTCNQYIPHRQPTIVCEDIADDIDFDDDQEDEVNNEQIGAALNQSNGDMTRSSSSSSMAMLQRSASSSSLTVPAKEVELDSTSEKRRPPITTSVSAEQMITI